MDFCTKKQYFHKKLCYPKYANAYTDMMQLTFKVSESRGLISTKSKIHKFVLLSTTLNQSPTLAGFSLQTLHVEFGGWL